MIVAKGEPVRRADPDSVICGCNCIKSCSLSDVGVGTYNTAVGFPGCALVICNVEPIICCGVYNSVMKSNIIYPDAFQEVTECNPLILCIHDSGHVTVLEIGFPVCHPDSVGFRLFPDLLYPG